MDALCAIVVPEFSGSQWCDQEVGIALGQHKLVLSINKGANPYGVFGKLQALKSKKTASEMALDVWKVIANNDRTKDLYSEKLIGLLLNVKNDPICKDLLQVLSTYENIDKRHIEYFHMHYSENSLLMDVQNLYKSNLIFNKYGLPAIVENNNNVSVTSFSTDLPF